MKFAIAITAGLVTPFVVVFAIERGFRRKYSRMFPWIKA
jgi:hypothetical protein